MPSSKRTRGKERKANIRAATDTDTEAVANSYGVSGGFIADTALSKKLKELENNPKLSKRSDATRGTVGYKELDALAESLESNLKVAGGKRKPPEGYEYCLPETACTHGQIYPDLSGSPAGSMHVTDAAMNYFGDLYSSHPMDESPQAVGITAIIKVSDKFPAIIYDPYSRSVIISALVKFAADNLLIGIERNSEYSFIVAKWCAEAMAMLEGFEGIERLGPNVGLDKFYASKDTSKNEIKLREALGDGERRGIIRYIKKRIPCKCLDQMHERHTSEETKKGMCINCRGVFDFIDLKRCTGCGISHYCGSDCQHEDWPHHKPFCRLKSRER